MAIVGIFGQLFTWWTLLDNYGRGKKLLKAPVVKPSEPNPVTYWWGLFRINGRGCGWGGQLARGAMTQCAK